MRSGLRAEGTPQLLRALLLACVVWWRLWTAEGRARDVCTMQPSINGLCVSTTLGIYYDVETQRCHFLGCSPDKRLFQTLEDCERICNNNRHRRRRVQQHGVAAAASTAAPTTAPPTTAAPTTAAAPITAEPIAATVLNFVTV